jgi:hypothetical protein
MGRGWGGAARRGPGQAVRRVNGLLPTWHRQERLFMVVTVAGQNSPLPVIRSVHAGDVPRYQGKRGLPGISWPSRLWPTCASRRGDLAACARIARQPASRPAG